MLLFVGLFKIAVAAWGLCDFIQISELFISAKNAMGILIEIALNL